MPPSSSPRGSGEPNRLAWLPLLLIGLLFAFLLLPRVARSADVHGAFVAVGLALLGWQVVLWLLAKSRGRTLAVEVGALSPQHYIQTFVQLGLYAYWGYYWRPIYDQAPLILAQLVFLFAFDALFSWSRGRAWRLATGPIPIVLSTNLFIWFRDEWFVWQFAMIVIGLLGKEFVKWHKEGRRTHVFNPSGLGLLVTSVVLLVLGNTEQVTLALPLASTIDFPPAIFLVLFLLGLVVQHFFSVTLMTLCAAITTIAVNFVYHQVTGVWLFLGSNLPAAGFLGLLLLMTDPSTSPRTHLGRALFGVGYGLGYCLTFELLVMLDAPTLYAKLFPVPILNLTVKVLDRLAATGPTGRLEQRWRNLLSPRALNSVHIAIWAAIFFTMLGTGYVQSQHEGSRIEFWKRAFAEGRHLAGSKMLSMILAKVEQGSSDANNERGIVTYEGKALEVDRTTANRAATQLFSMALHQGSAHAAPNLVLMCCAFDEPVDPRALEAGLARLQQAADRGDTDAMFLLGFASETGRGRSRDPGKASAWYHRCGADHLHAQKALARLALAAGKATVAAKTIEVLTQAAAADREACYYLAFLFARGIGVDQDESRARTLLQQATGLGLERAAAAAVATPLPAFTALSGSEMVLPPFSTAYPI